MIFQERENEEKQNQDSQPRRGTAGSEQQAPTRAGLPTPRGLKMAAETLRGWRPSGPVPLAQDKPRGRVDPDPEGKQGGRVRVPC